MPATPTYTQDIPTSITSLEGTYGYGAYGEGAYGEGAGEGVVGVTYTME